MSQTPSPQEPTPSSGQLEIGPEGTIVADNPNNASVLALINQAAALTPIELYALAVSYQQSTLNSGLGNRLAFIGLHAILQHPAIQPILAAPSQHQATIQLASSKSLCPWYCAFLPNNTDCQDCIHPTRPVRPIPADPPVTNVKRITYNGLELLVEVTQTENKTYTLLGVSPTHL